VDGRGSVTPPGKWNQIAISFLENKALSESDSYEMFALLNVALADSFISAWDTKYAYWTARPVSAAKLLFNVEFKPLILTPSFPSFTSGHATFSSAASVILGHYFPFNKDEFHRMAVEAAHSRLLGGIHFRFDNEAGFTVGQKIGHLVLQHFNKG
jgi:membrane-associated phospholipid phosphatase